jgi:hypothetical protein
MRLPGRIINAETRIAVTRTLPTAGEVLAHPGLRVEALDIIARAEIPHRYQVVDVGRQLANPRVDMSEVMLKSVGESVEANEIIATAPGNLPLLKRSARAQAAGTITAIGPGWVLIETERTVVEVPAFINGIVAKVTPQQSIVIETKGALIEAAVGFGGEAYGRLQRLVDSPAASLTADMLHENVQHTILIGGRSVDETVLRQAEAMQVRGIIVGSIDAALLKLGPPVKVRVVATEGFGNGPMAPYTFALLNKLIGREVSIRGQTPLLKSNGQSSEADQPVILATTAYSSTFSKPIEEESPDIKIGSHVRVTRGRLLGATGHIDSLPTDPQPTESGIIAPGASVTIDQQLHFIPWANLEQIL